MRECDSKPLQCFVTPEIHRTLKLRAFSSETTIAAIVRELVTDYCARTAFRDAPASGEAPKK
jgi:hypothetical protein